MREHRCEKDKIERRIVKREAVLRGLTSPVWVVSLVIYVGEMKVKVSEPGRISLLTPLDGRVNDVQAVIAAISQVPRKWPGHPTSAAPYIQHSLVRFQSRYLREVAKEFFTNLGVVAVSNAM